MKLDRYMVNLFFEIKRNLPLEQQQDMLISNPEIEDVMINLYQITDDDNVKLLTGIFLERADTNWIKNTNKKKTTSNILSKLIDNTQPPTSNQQQSKKPKRIYRGQVVED